MRLRLATGAIGWLLRLIRRWAICLPPFGIYVLPEHCYNQVLIRHEKRHWQQAQQLGTMKFYTKYLWLLLRHGYENHPMEQDANRYAKL